MNPPDAKNHLPDNRDAAKGADDMETCCLEIIPFSDMIGAAGRRRVFLTGMKTLAALLAFYIIAQLTGLAYVDNSGFLNGEIYRISIISNAVLLGMIATTILMVLRIREDSIDEQKCYHLVVVVTAAMLAAALFQIHVVGSQNSLHHLLIVAVLLVVSWFLKWREVILFFVLGNLGLALLVYLEATGVLSYAPLFTERSELARIFLNWRIILGQSINYFFVLAACLALIWKMRLAVERSEKLRGQTHRALVKEVEERKRSEKEKEQLIDKLNLSLEQVNTLRSLLPICSKCRKIRDDKGYWRQLESYFSAYAPAIKFTHGLCPDCAAEIYPDEFPEEK